MDEPTRDALPEDDSEQEPLENDADVDVVDVDEADAEDDES